MNNDQTNTVSLIMQDGRNLEERAVGQSGQRNANGISTTEKRGGFLNPTFLHLIGLDVRRVTFRS